MLTCCSAKIGSASTLLVSEGERILRGGLVSCMGQSSGWLARGARCACRHPTPFVAQKYARRARVQEGIHLTLEKYPVTLKVGLTVTGAAAHGARLRPLLVA